MKISNLTIPYHTLPNPIESTLFENITLKPHFSKNISYIAQKKQWKIKKNPQQKAVQVQLYT